ncbi:MAG: hypothetical protein KJZ65_07380 [Phycisphaerales bacterium]|nr:hypothetical protein [Phycisphaerales bacterium]
MSRQQRPLMAAAGSLIACGAVAQVAPTCCNFIGIWPEEGNPDGACAGTHASFCTTGSIGAELSDPMARRWGDVFTPHCWEITLTGDATFVHQDCALPPPAGWIGLVGVPLPDGQCCYIVGDPDEMEVLSTPQPFQIPRCSGNCVSIIPG